MEVQQYHLRQNQWSPVLPSGNQAQLLFCFGDRKVMGQGKTYELIKDAFPQAEVVGCTTSGEILADDVYDNTLALTAIHFDETNTQVVSANSQNYTDSIEVGIELASRLEKDNLKAVLVFSDGQLVNGSELVAALKNELPEGVFISGGLAGDDDRFEETVVWHNQVVEPGLVILCGLYGDAIHAGHGSLGGWSTFGPDREVTLSEGNILYELDGQPALDLYKKYLGEFASELPGAALRFPLNLKLSDSKSVVRTILSVNENNKSMVFAGNIPEGATVQLMKSSFDDLVDGAKQAAAKAQNKLNHYSPQLGLLISCVGRRLVMGQRVFEELERVKQVLGEDCPLCGFYSYGEISPEYESLDCQLHNQTMTITVLSEDKPATH